MRAILLGPILKRSSQGRKIFRSLKITSQDLILAVDGGLKVWTELGIKPHFAVGDWDSLPKKDHGILRRFPHLTLPQSKDRSDLFFAIIAAMEAGFDEFVCLGVTGGPRPDHHLGMLFDLCEFSTGQRGRVARLEARGEDADYYFLSEGIPSWKASLPIGQRISVFGMKGGASGVTLSGFRYEMKNGQLGCSSHGLSNEVTEFVCEVRVKKGELLITIPKEKAQNG